MSDFTERRLLRSDDYRADPNNRHYESSYTKQVVTDLLDHLPYRCGARGAAVVAAAELLQDYHETQHVVYEQRDAARCLAEREHALNQTLTAENARLREQLKDVIDLLADTLITAIETGLVK